MANGILEVEIYGYHMDDEICILGPSLLIVGAAVGFWHFIAVCRALCADKCKNIAFTLWNQFYQPLNVEGFEKSNVNAPFQIAFGIFESDTLKKNSLVF